MRVLTITTIVFLCVTAFNADFDKEASIKRGQEVYSDFCITCHLGNGEGIQGVFPPLADADYLFDNLEESIKGVKYGMKGKITVNGVDYNNVMASQGLSDEEVADVMNYILNSWGNTYEKTITPDQVAKLKKD